jgi:hypothetical protein
MEVPAEPEWRAGWLAGLMPDPGPVPDGAPVTPVEEAVAAAGVAHWEVTGVAMAAHCPEEAGGMVGEVAGEQDDIEESKNRYMSCVIVIQHCHPYVITVPLL